jgi:hypothetical protein
VYYDLFGFYLLLYQRLLDLFEMDSGWTMTKKVTGEE